MIKETSKPTLLFGHPDIYKHDAVANHVAMESNRIQRIYDTLASVEGVHAQQSPLATRETLELAHSREFISHLVDNAPTVSGKVFAIDQETIMNEHTLNALLRTAGGVCAGVDAVLAGEAKNAFNVGYAGHHALPDAAMGFCFTNAIAIAGKYALEKGVKKLAILDIDTHSGNGTVMSFWPADERVLFAETYQQGFPGNFMPGNRPPHILRKLSKTATDFYYDWKNLLKDVAVFGPELILLSAGFDAHIADPLGTIGLNDNSYEWLMGEILKISPHVVATLEGGYNLDSTSRCAAIALRSMVQAGS